MAAKKSPKRSPKKSGQHFDKYFEKINSQVQEFMPKKKSKSKDTSGRLKTIHGRGAKRQSKKQRKNSFHYIFYKDAPKGIWERSLWSMHPQQLYRYWFSRHGAWLAGKILLAVLSLLLLMGFGVYSYYSRELPDPEEINRRILNQSTRFYDRSGEILLYETFGDEDRNVVEFDEISETVRNATIAIEDKDFYDHMGLDLTGISRAAISNVFGGSKSTQGGSTITQQFIKKALLTDERTFERKIKEAILSLELERIYSKDEILTFYLNEVPYGGTSYGIEAASQNYFGKSASKINLAESAVLAALPQRPTFFINNLDQLESRKDHVLDQMVAENYINQEQAERAKEHDTVASMKFTRNQYKGIKAPHFVLEAQSLLEDKYGPDIVANGGLEIITTINIDLQKIAEKAVSNHISYIESVGGNNASLVAQDPETGQILAYVGSRDFDFPKFGAFDVASARRQPGSSVKPYAYSSLMKENFGAGTTLYDLTTEFATGNAASYRPKNSGGSTVGAISVRNAIGQSRNIPAVKATYIQGHENLMDTMSDLGVSLASDSPTDYGISLGIGAGEVKLVEHTGGYATLANDGIKHNQVYIIKVSNSRGEVLEEWQEEEGEQVLDAQIASIMKNIVSDHNAKRATFGSATRFFEVPGVQTGGKTGTTNDARDGWLMGFSSGIATGVWAGHSDNKPMHSYSALLAGPIWNEFMVKAHKKIIEAEDFEIADGVKRVTLDKHTGRLPSDSTTSTTTDYFPSWYKPAKDESTEPFTIDTVSGKLATDCTPEGAKKTVTGGGIVPEIPPSDPAYKNWLTPIQKYAKELKRDGGGVKPKEQDDIHKCSDTKPTVEISGDITNEGGNTYKVAVNVTKGTHRLDQLDFKLDGQIMAGGAMDISNPGTYEKTFTATGGSHKVSVIVTDEALYSSQTDKTFTANESFGATSTNKSSYEEDDDVTFHWIQHNSANSYRIFWSGPGSSASTSCIDGSKKKHKQEGSSFSTAGTYNWTIKAYNTGICVNEIASSSGPSFEHEGSS